MITANDRLMMAMKFLNSDLETEREGDLLNARDDFVEFVFPKVISDPPPGRVLVSLIGDAAKKRGGEVNPGRDELRKIQHDGRQMFGEFIQLRDSERSGKLPSKVHRQTITGRWLLFPHEIRRGVALGYVDVDNLRDAFLATLLHLTLGGDTGNVRACPVCGKLFVRTRRQDYDSPRCASVATTRAKRERDRRKLEAEKAKKGANKKRAAARAKK